MTREVLPTRRCHVHFDLKHNGHLYRVGVGYSGIVPDGKPKEVFIDAGKSGTDMRDAVRDLAVALSVAFQHGATVQELRRTFTRDDQDNPSGIGAAIIDYLLKAPEDENEAPLIAAE